MAAALALLATGTGPAWGQEKQAKADPSGLSTSVPIIYAHGFTTSGGVGVGVGVDCSSTFADMFNALSTWGHTGGDYTASYYQNDTSCWWSREPPTSRTASEASAGASPRTRSTGRRRAGLHNLRTTRLCTAEHPLSMQQVDGH